MLEWEWKVTLDNLIAFGGFVFVGLQMRDGNQQRKLESQIQLQAVIRELLSLGFSNPELFKVLEDADNVDPKIETYYLQLWLNQFCAFHALSKKGNLERDVRDSLEIDFRDMMGMKNMRRLWEKSGKFYPASFQRAVNATIDEAGHETASLPEPVRN